MMVIHDVSCPIKNAIWNCLNHYAYGDALFLAERLFAEVGSDDALYLLATAYYRIGKPKIVQVLLEKHGLRLPECKLLYAQACFDQSEYVKAEHTLTSSAMKFSNITTMLGDISVEFGDASCFALALLGKMYQRTERPEMAEKCFSMSLKLNPLLWTSFERMCEAGKKPNPEEHFHVEVQPTVINTQINTPQNVMPTRKKKGNAVKVLAPSQVGSNTEGTEPFSNLSERIADPKTNISNVTPSAPVSTPPNSTDVNRGSDRCTTGSKDSSTLDQTAMDFFRSTPSEQNEWDSSIDSYTGLRSAASDRRYIRTNLQGTKSLVGPAALSPLTPSFGVMPLIETPSPAWERSKAMVTPTDMAPPPVDRKVPAKRMATRQSRKVGDAPTATSKLLFSSENSRANDPTCESPNPESATAVTTTRRNTRSYVHSTSNSVKENAKKHVKGKSNQPKDVLKRNARFRQTKLAGDIAVKDLSDEISKVESSCEKSSKPSSPQPYSTNQYVLAAHKTSIDGLMTLLRDMGNALLALCQFDCRKAVQYIESLPPHQRATTWPLSALARAYFEMTEYKKASDVFEELRTDHPHHVTGLALYSTTLWHLQDSIALSTLAHSLIELDPMSTETWCSVGNCFSLRHDNESAVKFFCRAVQIDPQYAYAHTLLGHEYAYSDDNERAMACYRKAIHCDPRHYNAWYGIGSIYYKQENFALAEIHFKKALSINMRSSVLLCHLGIVQHAQKRSTTALNTLANALSLEPRNALCKFHRASILFATDRHEEALKELLQLKLIVPKESLVYFLLGKVYKVLGENHLAMMNFSWALDLDPKGINNHIKEAIDKQQAGEDGKMFDDGGETDNNEDSNNSSGDLATAMVEDESTEHDSDESL
uniref:Cell division cycle protein 27 homolog n=1 Tax=Phallusia mammillata TaxID=59560 RepID=A0A6F9D9F4_9ASCI|nr:cell division cycle protein 27 homolog [Phallusia mammillata]